MQQEAESEKLAIGQMVGGQVMPLTGVTRLAMSANVNEIAVFLGRNVHGFGQDGQPLPTPGIEWLFAGSVSPALAKGFHEGLTEVLRHYEERFGKIPQDPNQKVEVKKL